MKKFPCLLILVSITWLICSSVSAAESSPERFTGIYEPSGVAQLVGGDIVVIEDNEDMPLLIFVPEKKAGKLVLVLKQRLEIKGYSYDDLEGVEVGPGGELFAITSHGLKSSPKGKKRKKTRERLLKINQLDGTIDITVGPSLYSTIMAALGAKDEKPSSFLNIEALGFDHKQGHLLLGLRSPLGGEKAIILEMTNPEAYFTEGQAPDIKARAFLSVKGGLRAMCFDPFADRYLLASETQQGEDNESILWAWDGVSRKVDRLQVAGLNKMKNVEGITLFTWENKQYLLLVSDDGKKKKAKGAHYLIVEYKNL